jgi:hypothetical protein
MVAGSSAERRLTNELSRAGKGRRDSVKPYAVASFQ